MTYHQVDPRTDFVNLVTARQKAEDVARSSRARRIMSKLSNTTVRQPLRTYNPMDLVKVWRRVWPQTQHKGPRGGFKMSARPHWVGPGRVVFSEVLPRQERDDDRRHIVWVLIGKQLLRCSVHSVRPVSETERFEHETSGTEDPGSWKSLADLLPKREYYDIVDQANKSAKFLIYLNNRTPQPLLYLEDVSCERQPSSQVTTRTTQYKNVYNMKMKSFRMSLQTKISLASMIMAPHRPQQPRAPQRDILYLLVN